MAQGWKSYDAAADSHDRIAVPTIFAAPARDLVAQVGMPGGGRVLDVGAGTGVVALAAMQVAGPGTVVMGVDPSFEMLRAARAHGLLDVAVGAVPWLPYADAVFDRVLASFVLSHLPSYEAGLRDLVRVLRPGGKLGMTAWGSIQNECRERWEEVAETFVDKDALRAAAQEAIPWEEWFESADHLRQAFQDAGLTGVEVFHAVHTARMSMADFLGMRQNSISGRFMRQTMSEQRWREFQEAVASEFQRAFRDPIEHVRDVNIVVGTHPH